MTERIRKAMVFLFLGAVLLGYFFLVHGDPFATTGSRLTRTPIYGVAVGVVSVLLGIALLLDVDPVVDVLLQSEEK